MSKNGNFSKNNTKKTGPSILTFNAREIFNYLQLAFIKTTIFKYFNLKYHIWIKIDTSGYVIKVILSQLNFVTSTNLIVINTNLSQ